MSFVMGLYAPASQSFPPVTYAGQTSASCPSRVKTSSAFSVTAPVEPSMSLTTFCVMVGVAHRNSPVARSSV